MHSSAALPQRASAVPAGTPDTGHPTPRQLLCCLLNGDDLTEAEAESLLAVLADPDVDLVVKGAMLAALRVKGETPEEVRGLARGLRSMATPFDASAPAGVPVVDTCGTGGDGSSSFNLSTATALCAAAVGNGAFRMVKHGNRSVSSSSGSADVLEALGITLPTSAEDARGMLDRCGFTFLFAPLFHGATRAVVPVRRSLGARTVFNMLGPLSNPSHPTHQLVGAYDLRAARTMANALSGMEGLERAFVVHGEPGWDEATPVGPFVLLDVIRGKVDERVLDPEVVAGIRRCRPEDLAGGDPSHNASALRSVLAGEHQGPHADAVALNVGLVLELVGSVESLGEGVEKAREGLAQGLGATLISSLSEEAR